MAFCGGMHSAPRPVVFVPGGRAEVDLMPVHVGAQQTELR